MDYTKCLVELDEVLRVLNAEELSKIPKEIREMIKSQKDKNYIWKYDETKSLKEQNLDRTTIAMLSYLNMEYLLDEEQKKLMEEFHQLNERKAEREKKLKYESNDLFNKDEKSNKEELVKDLDNVEKMSKSEQLAEYKEQSLTTTELSIGKKIINKIKNLFKRKMMKKGK